MKSSTRKAKPSASIMPGWYSSFPKIKSKSLRLNFFIAAVASSRAQALRLKSKWVKSCQGMDPFEFLSPYQFSPIFRQYHATRPGRPQIHVWLESVSSRQFTRLPQLPQVYKRSIFYPRYKPLQIHRAPGHHSKHAGSSISAAAQLLLSSKTTQPATGRIFPVA